jgi:hypothetical protein
LINRSTEERNIKEKQRNTESNEQRKALKGKKEKETR